MRTPVRRGRSVRRLAAVAGVVLASVAGAVATVPAAAGVVNLVVNPGLESTSGGQVKCFTAYGYGTRTATTKSVTGTAAHSGNRALLTTVTGHQSGDDKVMPTQSPACAPAVRAGSTYTASVWYHSTTPLLAMTAFVYTPATGWRYWTELAPSLPVSKAWTQATAVTPAIPAGVTAMTFGISIVGDGKLWVDDFSLIRVADPVVDAPPGTCTGTAEQCAHGEWTVLDFPSPVRAIHTILLNNGKLLFMAGSGNQVEMTNFTTSVWDPRTNTWTDVFTPDDVFCSGHVQLPNGNVLVLGGNKAYPVPGGHGYEGLKSSYIFDVASSTYQRVNDLNTGHWYPSATVLGNGDVFAMGGLDETSSGTVTNELFDTATQQWLPTNQVPQQYNYFGLYPSNILTASGKLFYSGSHVFGNQGNPNGTGSYFIDLQANTLTAVPGLQAPNERDQSAAVLLPPAQAQKVLVMGGGNVDTNVTANRFTDLIDLSVTSPAYTAGPLLPQGTTETGAHADMNMSDMGVVPETGDQGKMYVSAVILPDRTVFETGGALHNRADPVYEASNYDPRTNTFTPMAPDPVARHYHSESVLYTDGTVISVGSNPGDGSFEMRISVYRPPYTYWTNRPTLSAPSTNQWTYGSTFTLKGSDGSTSAELIKPAAVTHSSDPNQRLVDLPLTRTAAGSYRVTVPANANLAPPGWYMVFVQNRNGPSSAQWVHIGPGSAATTVVATAAAPVGVGTAATAAGTSAAGGHDMSAMPHPGVQVGAVDGCAREYGTQSQCVPAHAPGGGPLTCDVLAAAGDLPLLVRLDPLGVTTGARTSVRDGQQWLVGCD